METQIMTFSIFYELLYNNGNFIDDFKWKVLFFFSV